MQKLLTIYLDNSRYTDGRMFVGSYADQHGLVEEHLAEVLKEGWTIKAIHGFGGNDDGLAVRGWIAVVVERPG